MPTPKRPKKSVPETNPSQRAQADGARSGSSRARTSRKSDRTRAAKGKGRGGNGKKSSARGKGAPVAKAESAGRARSTRASRARAETGRPDRKPKSPTRRAKTRRRPAPTAAPVFVERRAMGADRADTLLHLEERLSERIVGKAEAIAAIARIIRISWTNLDFRPERPNGAFLLVGPEGVGKNEIAYAVGEVLYGSDESVVSIDLGEFDDEEDLAKLGATLVPGSETHYLPGMLTAPVRENPEAILLLRGLEQAHPAMQRMLLHILERGRIEDMLGEIVFDRTLVFVTLTLSREELTAQEIGFGRPTKSAEARLREVLGRVVMPDLLDAFHEILELPPLSMPEVRQIARYKVDKVLRRMAERKTSIAVADSVYEELITDDLCRHGGAKFLNRTLEQRLFNPLARYLLEHRTSRRIQIGMDHGRVVIDARELEARDDAS